MPRGVNYSTNEGLVIMTQLRADDCIAVKYETLMTSQVTRGPFY